jgi:hypothetical protein
MYKFLVTVWHDDKSGAPNKVYKAGTTHDLDWPKKNIRSALAAGLIEEVITKAPTGKVIPDEEDTHAENLMP